MKTQNPVARIGASLIVTLLLIVATYFLLPKDRSVGAASRVPPPAADKQAREAVQAEQKRARIALGQVPLSFEMNRGQFDPQVQFASRGAGYKAFFTQTETVFVLRKPGAAPVQVNTPFSGTQRSTRAAQEHAQSAADRAASKAIVRMSLVGADPAARMSGVEQLPGKINYFRGNNPGKWITDVPTFRKVSSSGVYPGIDLVYYGKGNELEYDLVVAPGADPNQIGFAFDGAERVEVDAASGALVITAPGGAQLRQGKPLIYQEVNGTRRAVSGGFTVSGNGAGFSVGDYDHSRPLVIDPAIINYSTYLAGDDDDRVHGLAADADGNAYAVGWTISQIFPVKNAYQAGQNNDSAEAFVTKFNPDGSQLIWSTYLGGGDGFDPCGECLNADDGAYGVALDSARNVYVTGFAFSSDFPTYLAMQPHLSDELTGEADSFITKLNAAGNQLVFSTYFGGADGNDSGRGIAVDKNNNVYVVGYTNSFAFPTTNPIQPEIDGRTNHFHIGENWDGYLAKIDSSGQFRVYSTYIGGPSQDIATAVAVDANGAAYVTGWTDSTQPEPTPDPSASPTPTPDPSATPTPTPSATPATHFPITANAFQQNPGGGGLTRDAFVLKVDPAGTQYLYSTYLGGNRSDVAWGIALGPDRSAYVTGYTNSGLATMGTDVVPSQNEFPTTANAFQLHNAGGFDAFLTRLTPDGSDLVYSTYIGGAADEGDDSSNACLDCADRIDGGAVAVDVLGNAYITGWTESTFVATPTPSATATATATATVGARPNSPNGMASPTPVNFPTKDAFQPDPGSNPGTSGSDARDAFVCMFNTNEDGDDSLIYSSFLGGSHRDEGQAISVDPGGNLFVGGWTQSGCFCSVGGGPDLPSPENDFPTTTGAFQEAPGSFDDGFVVAFVGGSSTVIGQGLGFMISGQVTLADDGSPVPGVTITLTKPDNTTVTTTTDSNGTYSFANLPPVPEAPYQVTPSGLGYVYTPPSASIVITNKNERADFVASFPEPEPSPSASPTATATATATPTVTPASQALNLSTRLHVLTGDQVGIGGFIITGSAPKRVIVRAIGPDLKRFGVPDPLPDPVLELHGPGSFQTITNDNWRDTQEAEIKATGLAPTNDLESAIVATLAPGNYTGIIRGNNGGTGIGLIEVYDLDTAAASKLSNISTRGFVGGTPGDAIIAGFILGGQNAPDRVIIRGLGPSLSAAGVPNTLQNPTLELHNGDGTLLFTNNDWQDNPSQAAEVAAAGLAPSDSHESAIAVTLPPGAYTAILAGLGGTSGNGLVEIYDRGAGP